MMDYKYTIYSLEFSSNVKVVDIILLNAPYLKDLTNLK